MPTLTPHMYWQNFTQIVGLFDIDHVFMKQKKKKKEQKKLEPCVIMCLTFDQMWWSDQLQLERNLAQSSD